MTSKQTAVKKDEFEVIFCIINKGYSLTVMDAAKSVGAKGGTLLNAKGTGNKENEEFFGITIQPEKEIVVILVNKNIRDAVLHEIYDKAGLETKGQGIAFALPVNAVAGLQPKKSTLE